MDPKVQDSILARLQKLEEEAVRIRMGDVTSRGPLAVDIGSSGYSSGAVKALGGFQDEDRVACLLAGNALFVLGALGNGWTYGVGSVTGAGTADTTDVVAHGLAVSPRVVIGMIGPGANAGLNVGLDAKDATNLTFRFRHIDGTAWSSTHDYYWLAIHDVA